jgi:hypothetical protein
MIQHRWVRILLAAARLAALYAACVVVLFTAYGLYVAGPASLRELVVDSPLIAAVGFVVGFILLAIAKRIGFVVLWVLLLALWVSKIRDTSWSVYLLPDFLQWTVLAAPLYALTAIGLSADNNQRRLKRELLITAAIWAIVSGLALKFSYLAIDVGYPHAPYSLARAVANYLCVPLPFLIGARELLRVGFAMRTTVRGVAAA